MASSSLSGYGPSNKRLLYFDGLSDSYLLWETRFLSYLYTIEKSLQKAILPLKAGEADDEDFEEKNKWAFAELVQYIDEKSLQLVMVDAMNKGREALQILRSHHASTEKPKILTLYEELTTLRHSKEEDITDYILRAERAATGLRSAGERITDNLIIAMLLKGLSDEYKPFIVVHTQLDKVKTFTEFKAALHNYANTESVRHKHADEHSIMSSKYSKTYSCHSCGKQGHKSHECRTKGKLYCNHCKKPGHMEKVCFAKKKSREKSSVQTEHVSSTNSTSYSFTMQDRVMASYNSNALLVDCGATCHVVNNEALLVSRDDTFEPHKHFLQLADGSRTNDLVTARGDAQMTIFDSKGNPTNIILKNALLAPSFPLCLFSVRAATDAGASVIFQKQHAELSVSGVQFPIVQLGRLYFLSTSNQSAAVVRRRRPGRSQLKLRTARPSKSLSRHAILTIQE